MALLAAYMMVDATTSLEEWLETKVFANMNKEVIAPQKDEIYGFNQYFAEYKSGLKFFKD